LCNSSWGTGKPNYSILAFAFVFVFFKYIL
jgi:hypothetical protein